MKRLLIALAAIITITASVFGQTANRKGFFMEAQVGSDLGTVLSYNITYTNLEMPYLKGGVTAMFDIGYRFRTSNHFAFELKAGGFANTEAKLDYTLNIHLMPGLRWTSNDFGSMSAYISLNIGAGARMGSNYKVVVPVELSAGLNITRNFYLGVSFMELILPGSHSERYCHWVKPNHHIEYDLLYNTHGCLQLKLGYRF